jgi:hypothetical protein
LNVVPFSKLPEYVTAGSSSSDALLVTLSESRHCQYCVGSSNSRDPL